MSANERSNPGASRTINNRNVRPGGEKKLKDIESAVHAAILRGFVVGREVLVGRIPGIVVGYNIASFGRFVGVTYPLVVRTAMGVAKCSTDELQLA
jgi:hypothetical protein